LGLSSEGLGAEWRRLKSRIGGRPVLNIAKGLYRGPRGRVVPFSSLAGRKEAALGGPTIAREVGLGRPSAAVVAGERGPRALWTRALDGPGLRVVPLRDRVGVEVCGALKNVYAIGLGAVEGLRRKRGWETLDNLHAALFARSLGEMSALSRAAGGEASTAYTVAGAGDLEVTARAGRNYGFGVLLGSGHSVDGAAGRVGSTVEGARTARLAARMAAQRGLDLPLLKAVRSLLGGGGRAEDLLDLA
ncbi:MAG: NAD(P)H-dependent glycerol-3-phosphate dehydrogenase, partial [Halobacteria archaeon]